MTLTPSKTETKPKRIQRKRTKGWKMPPNCVYVGRPTKWGNPFAARVHGLDVAIRLYAKTLRGYWSPSVAEESPLPISMVYDLHCQWLKRFGRSHSLEVAISELRGKDLCCWCPLVDSEGRPVPCHADVLLEIANK